MPIERELKLELPADTDAQALAALLGLGAPAIKRLHATYFDTPDGALAKAQCSLRIRKEGRRRIQTVKTDAAPAAGLMARDEWEQPARGPRPSLDADNPVTHLLGARIDELAPRFEVIVERHVWQVETGAAAIEIALDRGEARADGASASFAEIELELQQGDADALFLLGGRIGAIAGARLGVLTKADRARRLLKPDKPDKARAIPLRPEMDAGDAFRLIVQNCLAHYRLNEARLLGADDADAVHQARVAIRRLRSAFRGFRAIAGGRAMDRFSDDLRWLAARLGEARDLDVLIDAAPDRAVRQRLSAARADAYATMRAAITSDLARGLMLAIAEWAGNGKWTRAGGKRAKRRTAPVADQAARSLRLFHERLMDEGDAVAGDDDEARHAARKTAKKLRYTAEFFARLTAEGKPRKARIRYLGALEELQDHLGALNDLATMPHTLARLGIAGRQADALAERVGRPEMLRLQAGDALAAIRAADPFWA